MTSVWVFVLQFVFCRLDLWVCFVDSRLLLLHQFWKRNTEHSTRSMSIRPLCDNFMDLLDAYALFPILSFVRSFVCSRRFLCCCSGICHFVNCNAILCTHSIHIALLRLLKIVVGRTANEWTNHGKLKLMRMTAAQTVHTQVVCGRVYVCVW